MGSTGLDHLAEDIVQFYKAGMDEITQQAMEAAKTRANECKEAIQRDSPKDSQEYAKGWKVRKIKNGYMVVNTTKPNVEMPLEHGHVITRGENKGKRTRAYPHIYDNADKAREAFLDDCTKIARKGGR